MPKFGALFANSTPKMIGALVVCSLPFTLYGMWRKFPVMHANVFQFHGAPSPPVSCLATGLHPNALFLFNDRPTFQRNICVYVKCLISHTLRWV